MIVPLFCRFITTIFGVLYPAYKSYKALRYKDVKELVRLTMYWIVFSCFIAFETVGDILLAWFPLYYEIKTVFVLYLVLPFTQGSSIIYRKIVHPQLSNKEKEIDQYIERAAESSCSALMHFGAKGLTYVANTAIHTAIKSQDLIINHLSQRSLSLDDIRPLALRDPGGDTANTYQSYRGGCAQASYQANRSSRHRYSTAIPLDNVTELTEEESQNADSFNAIESGDISRGDRHRKSTSDAVPIDVVVIVKGRNKTAQTPRLLPSFEYRASEHLYFTGQSKACCAESICNRDSLSCSYSTALSGEGSETSSTVAGADLSTAPRRRREPVGRPEEAQVVWPASLRQSHLHEKPHFPPCLSTSLRVRA